MSKFFEIICFAIIILFAYTAVDKIFHHASMVGVLRRTGFTPFLANSIAWSVPVSELLVVALLLIQGKASRGLKLALLLMTVFTGYIIYMLAISSHLPCTCGGVLSFLTWKQHLWVNIIIMAVLICAINKRPQNSRKTITIK